MCFHVFVERYSVKGGNRIESRKANSSRERESVELPVAFVPYEDRSVAGAISREGSTGPRASKKE